jgi:hypothetical protein
VDLLPDLAIAAVLIVAVAVMIWAGVAIIQDARKDRK